MRLPSWPKAASLLALGSLLAAGCQATLDTGDTGPFPDTGVPHTWIVTATAGDGGSIDPGTVTVDNGATTSFTVTPAENHVIAAVTGCAGTLSGDTYTTGPITSYCTVTAQFEVVSHTVTATAGTGGTIDPGSVTVRDGETARFTVTPDADYAIDAVSGCEGTLDGGAYATGPITADCTVSATFVATHTVTATAGANGQIDPASAVVVDGDTTSFTVTPDLGYGIDAVTGCGGALAGDTFTTGAITADCTVSASFARQPVMFTNGQPASLVIGEPNFYSDYCGLGRNLVGDVYGNPDFVDGTLFLGDYDNGRILGYDGIPTYDGANATFVVATYDFYSHGEPGYQTVDDDGSRLFAADYDDGAIHVYDPIPTAATTAPISSTPQDISFAITGVNVGGLDSPETLSIGGGKLVVTDSGNNRVLIWNTLPTTDSDPDLVLGQTDFTGSLANQDLADPTASTLSDPAGVWTDGERLVVLDTDNNRALVWNAWPTTNDQAADLVLGQTDFTGNLGNQDSTPTASTLDGPYDGVYASGDQLFIADTDNARVLVWNTWPTTNAQAADMVLGQANFTSEGTVGGPTTDQISVPTGVRLAGTRLVVGDADWCRYLVFDGAYP